LPQLAKHWTVGSFALQASQESIHNSPAKAGSAMTCPPPQGTPAASQQWPRIVAEAVMRLVQTLGQAEKDAIAATAEADLIELHFSPLGAAIREGFGLWEGNAALLADCLRARTPGACRPSTRTTRPWWLCGRCGAGSGISAEARR
jgi:hypothetical protein